jgi:alanine racemase
MKHWLEISERRLTDNYRALTSQAATTAVLAVVKANAYGHGATVCAPVLARAGAPWLGVTDAAEGCAVSKALQAEAAPRPRILVMSGLCQEDADAIVEHRLTPVVWTTEQMQWLADAVARQRAKPLPVHIEVDTGMARQGAAPGPDLSAALTWLNTQHAIRLDGVMTHFASSEVADSPQTHLQQERFQAAIQQVAASGLRPAWVHAGNTSTLDNRGQENLAWLRDLAATVGATSMVRTGIALYGYSLPIEPASPATVVAPPEIHPLIHPVMEWKTRVIGIRELRQDDTVGYNGIFRVDRPMRAALLPVGYADGLRRELSASNAKPGGWVMLHGQRAPILGRVSMNLTIVDITRIEGVRAGDEAVVLGEGITADDHARLAGTIPYEIICGMRAHSRLV